MKHQVGVKAAMMLVKIMCVALLCALQSVRAMQSCVGPSTSSRVDQLATEVRRASSLNLSQSASSKSSRQGDLSAWQSSGGKSSQQTQLGSDNRSSTQQSSDAKRKLPDWMNSQSTAGKTTTKKKLKNSSLFR